MMTPIRKLELMVGKILPYSVLTLLDAVLITILGVVLFHVTIRGNPLELLLFAVPYLVAALSIGLLISTVAQNQRQAMQTAAFLLLPQILLSGALFPLAAIPWGIRWVSQLLPLTYFTPDHPWRVPQGPRHRRPLATGRGAVRHGGHRSRCSPP